uniref:THD domain-containing protein n=1 Tax=Arion vulgaris TaxID=1028688 RepID=A0A0B6ZWM2_9EUPU
MAKDTRVTFDPEAAQTPSKPSNKVRHNRVTERQISYEDAENCVNELSESFPALSTRAHRLMRQVSGSFNNRTIKVALILSVVLNLLLGIPFGIFFGFWMSQKSESATDTSSSSSLSSPLGSLKSYSIIETCYPCSESDLDIGNRLKVKSKQNLCCTDDKVYVLENSPYVCLTADVFKRRCMDSTDSSRVPLPCKSGSGSADRGNGQSVVAAHLILDVEQTQSRIKDTSNRKQIALVWVDNDAQRRTFMGEGVEYSNGQIKINKAGKYHIYSHMTLSTNENPLPENEKEKIITHSLLWNARGATKDLLFSQVTIKPNEVKSSDIEGSFELLEGDIISVYLSHPSFVKNVPPANVFGLFIL